MESRSKIYFPPYAKVWYGVPKIFSGSLGGRTRSGDLPRGAIRAPDDRPGNNRLTTPGRGKYIGSDLTGWHSAHKAHHFFLKVRILDYETSKQGA